MANIKAVLDSSKQAYWTDFLVQMKAIGDGSSNSVVNYKSVAGRLADDYRRQWLQNHPNDRNLKYWKLSFDAWFAKYQHELPSIK